MPVADIVIPEMLIREFQKAPRIKMIFGPEGYWPIAPELLREQSEFFTKLFADKEFAATHEVVIMKKAM